MSPRGRLQVRVAVLGIVVVLASASVVLFSRTSGLPSAVALEPAPAVEPSVEPEPSFGGDPEDSRAVVVATPPAVPVAQAVTTEAPIPVAPSAAASATPSLDLPTVVPIRASVKVTLEPVDPAGGDVRAVVSQLDDVIATSLVRVSQTTLGGVPSRLAQVDLADFRQFTPDATANHAPLWERLAAGDVAVTHEFGTNHDVPLGSRLATDITLVTGDSMAFRVGAFATNGTPPIADAIVEAGQMPDEGTRILLIGLAEEGSPEATVEALEDLGLTAEEILDPRAPRSETVVPVEGITPENVWDHLALCESSGDWHINTGNGYYGGIQFLPESWAAVGGQDLPHQHSREEQIYRGTLLWQIQGWNAWPQCARKLGLIVDRPPPQPAPAPTSDPQPVQTQAPE